MEPGPAVCPRRSGHTRSGRVPQTERQPRVLLVTAFPAFPETLEQISVRFCPRPPGPLPPGVLGCAVSEPFAVPVPAAAAPAPPADCAVNKLWYCQALRALMALEMQ